jgi:hypothetical protein
MNHQISELLETDPSGSKLLGGLLKLVRIDHRKYPAKERKTEGRKPK